MVPLELKGTKVSACSCGGHVYYSLRQTKNLFIYL